MAIPEVKLQSVLELLSEVCIRRTVPDEAIVSVALHGNKVNLVETRRMFIDPREQFECKIAQLEFSPKSNSWTLYWFDLKSKRHQYPAGLNKDTPEKLVAEIDRDPTGIFWD